MYHFHNFPSQEQTRSSTPERCCTLCVLYTWTKKRCVIADMLRKSPLKSTFVRTLHVQKGRNQNPSVKTVRINTGCCDKLRHSFCCYLSNHGAFKCFQLGLYKFLPILFGLTFIRGLCEKQESS